jgi:hypothetical protein
MRFFHGRSTQGLLPLVLLTVSLPTPCDSMRGTFISPEMTASGVMVQHHRQRNGNRELNLTTANGSTHGNHTALIENRSQAEKTNHSSHRNRTSTIKGRAPAIQTLQAAKINHSSHGNRTSTIKDSPPAMTTPYDPRRKSDPGSGSNTIVMLSICFVFSALLVTSVYLATAIRRRAADFADKLNDDDDDDAEINQLSTEPFSDSDDEPMSETLIMYVQKEMSDETRDYLRASASTLIERKIEDRDSESNSSTVASWGAR